MKPFRIDVPQADLDDLRRRLANTRWPAVSSDADWSRGVPMGYLQELAEYWSTSFDWRAAEAKINKFPQFTTEIDGANVHFIHVRSPEGNATPMIMTHGWPGSPIEYLDVIEALTDPRSHGGNPDEAYHLVIPSIPGFGFSGPTSEPGWTLPRIAHAWGELMAQLDYEHYVAQGGDLGAVISILLGHQRPQNVSGVHVNFLITAPSGDPAQLADFNDSDFGRLGVLTRFADELSGYMKLQSTRPQTVSYALTDSPVGQLAWIVEKFKDWTDSDKEPEDAVDRDQLLTNVTAYWLTNTAGSTAHFYFDNADLLPTAPTPQAPPPPLPVPLGVAVYPHDPALPIRKLADPLYPDIVHWAEYERGGHFAAMEEPDLFIGDLQAFRRALPR
ncbi:epoxide hydrolase family protein [Streptomyces cahuitamycinicus]|uniref:Epoxide hydrolase n=1 Tax=Streptomyces cahuitamycinicus TaxID=2070367 RepID=A0A2N8TXS9_9ACTN|nr:epoxide hydrolase family protein [Streptomyces cahuitamycinicus]PNG23816.1 epoxide hydrolase [Streptomyces cahuitamycinicus]